jgi:hypothetical protein
VLLYPAREILPHLQRLVMGRTEKAAQSEVYALLSFFPLCLDLKMFKSKNSLNLAMFGFENCSNLKNVQI